MTKAEEISAKLDNLTRKLPADWVEGYTGMGLWDLIIGNGLQVVTVGVVGWLLATWFERRHFKSMAEREIPVQGVSISTAKKFSGGQAEAATLLIGSVVVAHDYFRTLIIFFRRIIGGNIQPYERLVERGRREALIRLKEEADLCGIDKIINVRFTTSSVSGRFLHAIEMVAYGTGVKTEPN
jgi:uncharacterized protein YbjQ (UPF0145 family)